MASTSTTWILLRFHLRPGRRASTSSSGLRILWCRLPQVAGAGAGVDRAVELEQAFGRSPVPPVHQPGRSAAAGLACQLRRREVGRGRFSPGLGGRHPQPGARPAPAGGAPRRHPATTTAWRQRGTFSVPSAERALDNSARCWIPTTSRAPPGSPDQSVASSRAAPGSAPREMHEEMQCAGSGWSPLS